MLSFVTPIWAQNAALDAAADNAATSPQVERAQLSGNAVNSRVDSDLKQIGLAVLQYVQDYDEKLPSMISAQSMAPIRESVNRRWDDPRSTKVQEVLQPYIKSAEVFAHPTTHEIYRPNINVSRRQLEMLEPQSRVVTFYEASPASDGTRAVLYLDGHVRRERETDWAAIRAASDAIAPPFKNSKRIAKAEVKPEIWVLVPKIKTAIGANRAMQGSAINVDGLVDAKQIVLRGTTASQAQKTLAEAIAKKNAPGFRIVNELVVARQPR